MLRQLHLVLPAALLATALALAGFVATRWGLFLPAERSALVPLLVGNLLLCAVLAWRLTRSEIELQSERERSGKVIEAVQSGIVDLCIDNAQGNYYSERAKEILGYARDADLGSWPPMVQ